MAASAGVAVRRAHALATLVTRGAFLACVTFIASVALGCPASSVRDNEVYGKKGAVIFTAETRLAFTTRLAVGSTFAVAFRASDPEVDLAGATLDSSDPAVLVVTDGALEVTVAGPGTAELRVSEAGELVDTVELRAGIPGATALVDGDLFAATGTVDSRLPSAFAIRTDVDTRLLVTAVDKCGGDMLDLHASTIVSDPAVVGAPPLAVTDEGAAAFSVKTQVPGELSLVLRTPGLDDLAYAVQSIEGSQVDEVTPAASAGDETGNVTLWGRAFVDDVELAGPVDFSWTASERVTLAAATGHVVTAAVSFPGEGEAPDDRPATVEAEVFGVRGDINLLNTTTTTSRGPPAREFVPPPATASCGDPSSVCDPAAAFLGVALVSARALRRVRRLATRPLTHRDA